MNKRSRDLDYLDHIANHVPALLTAIERLQRTLRLASDEPERRQDAE